MSSSSLIIKASTVQCPNPYVHTYLQSIGIISLYILPSYHTIVHMHMHILYHQIPHDQEQTQAARRIEHVLGRTLPLRRLLQLLIPAPHVLRRV